jgi:hypothetical protein
MALVDNHIWATIDAYPVNMIINNEYLYVNHINDYNKITKIDLNNTINQIEYIFYENNTQTVITPTSINIYNDYMYIGGVSNIIYQLYLPDLASIINESKEKSLSMPKNQSFEVGVDQFMNLEYSPRNIIIYEDYMYVITDYNLVRINLVNNEIIENWCTFYNGFGLTIYDNFIYVTSQIQDTDIFTISKVSLEYTPTVSTIVEGKIELTGLDIYNNYIYVINSRSIYKIDLIKTLDYFNLTNEPLDFDNGIIDKIITDTNIMIYRPINILIDRNNQYMYISEWYENDGKISRYDLQESDTPSVEQITAINQILNRVDIPPTMSQLFQNMRKTKENIKVLLQALNQIINSTTL